MAPEEEAAAEEEAATEEEAAAEREAGAAVGEQEADTAQTLEREEDPPVVTLLGLRTNALTYDFEEADETGDVLRGFRTTSLSNQISSDYLRGLTISMVHDLFDDSEIVQGEEGEVGERRFAPHLSQRNLSFNLNSESGIVPGLPLRGRGGRGRAGPRRTRRTSPSPGRRGPTRR